MGSPLPPERRRARDTAIQHAGVGFAAIGKSMYT